MEINNHDSESLGWTSIMSRGTRERRTVSIPHFSLSANTDVNAQFIVFKIHTKSNVFAENVNQEKGVVIGSGGPEKNKRDCDGLGEVYIGEEDACWSRGRNCGFRLRDVQRKRTSSWA